MTTTAKTILCVDDESNILNALKRALQGLNYRLLTTTKSDEAMAILRDNPVVLVISDQRMPAMKGTELLRQVKESYPGVARILLSGQTSPEDLVDAINVSEVCRFISKPWDDKALREAVAFCIEQESRKYETRTAKALGLLLHVVSQLPMPVMALDDHERVLFCNRALGQTFPSLACVREGIDLRAVLAPDLLLLVHRQMQHPGLELMETVELDGRAVRPRVQCVVNAGYVILFDKTAQSKSEHLQQEKHHEHPCEHVGHD